MRGGEGGLVNEKTKKDLKCSRYICVPLRVREENVYKPSIFVNS